MSTIRWSRGGTASIVSVDDEHLVLCSTTPAPPGARLAAVVITEPSTTITVKSYGSKRQADGSFTLKAKLLGAPRYVRDALARLCPSQETTGP